MVVILKIYSKTDVGKVRSSNQDAYFAGELVPNGALAIVCDGMGGANAGNVASETAIKIISEYILRSYRAGMDEFETEKMIKNAIISANMEIYDMAVKTPDLSGMGTTVVVALVIDSLAVIAHVGDSRAYLVGEDLKQLTRDHSVVQSLLESGKITVEDAKVHPRKNVITRALGAEENVLIDCTSVNLEEGKTLLLCTDGLSSYADASNILNVFNTTNPADVPNELVNLANFGGGGDNITVLTISL